MSPMPEPEVADPLARYRVDVEASADAIERRARERGERVVEVFAKPPVAVTEASLWLARDADVFRLPRGEITGLGQTRSSDARRMRWGAGLYIVSLFAFAVSGLVAILMAVGGGVLVVLGFLAKALLVQVEDERVPPFVIEHRSWRRIRDRLDAWQPGSPGPG